MSRAQAKNPVSTRCQVVHLPPTFCGGHVPQGAHLGGSRIGIVAVGARRVAVMRRCSLRHLLVCLPACLPGRQKGRLRLGGRAATSELISRLIRSCSYPGRRLLGGLLPLPLGRPLARLLLLLRRPFRLVGGWGWGSGSGSGSGSGWGSGWCSGEGDLRLVLR